MLKIIPNIKIRVGTFWKQRDQEIHILVVLHFYNMCVIYYCEFCFRVYQGSGIFVFTFQGRKIQFFKIEISTRVLRFRPF